MELATLCSVLVSLRVVPNRVQFFHYETVSLSCGDQGEASEWTMMRNTSLHTNQRSREQKKSSWFFNNNMYYKDAGVYWCQSEEGECGAAVNITVTAGDVLLESPLLPVKEGENVTLRCIWNPNKPRTGGTFEFFKDGFCEMNSTSEYWIIPSASLSDSGLYLCKHQGALSAESRLEVLKTDTAEPPPQLRDGRTSAISPVIYIVLPVCVASLALLLCTALICLWKKRKEREKHEGIYANFNIIRTPEPKRLKDLKTGDDSTFYSTLQLNFM